jgi:hypothetical protein
VRQYALFQGEVFLDGPYSLPLRSVRRLMDERGGRGAGITIKFRKASDGAWHDLPTPPKPRAHTSTEEEPSEEKLGVMTRPGGQEEQRIRRERTDLYRELNQTAIRYDFGPTVELLQAMRDLRRLIDDAEVRLLAFYMVKQQGRT